MLDGYGSEREWAFRRRMGDRCTTSFRERPPYDGDREVTADVGGSATDAEFAAGFQRDPELFAAVYDKYFRDVYRYVAGRLDNEAADDIAARL